MSKLSEARIKINEIDKQMAKLFCERMDSLNDVAEYKKEYALPVIDNQREQEIIQKNLSYVENDAYKDYYVAFMDAILKTSKDYQRYLLEGIKVAYCGLVGSFSYFACIQTFGKGDFISYSSFDEAYNAVRSGLCDTCLLPIENSNAGDVGEVMDLIFSGDLYINQVIELPVEESLLIHKEANIKDIKTVWSHPQALSQCSDYIQKHHYDVVEYSNTAFACEALSKTKDHTIGVIAHEQNASIYGFKCVETSSNTKKNNTTRFGVFSKHLKPNTSNNIFKDYSILVFTVKNEAGSLATALEIIGRYGFNMRNLRSRPMKDLLWNYYFYIEIEGNVETTKGKQMMNELKEICSLLRQVGSYYYHINK